MRVAVLVMLVSGSAPQVALPPSSGWEARADPAPAPEATATAFYVWRKDPNVRLRIGTMAALKQDYSPAFMMALAARMGKDARADGRTLQVTEALTFDVAGVPVGKLHTVDGRNQALLYWLPGAEGDVVVSLLGVDGAWDAHAEHEVARAVAGAMNLRAPAAARGEAVSVVTSWVAAGFAAAVLGAGLLGLWVNRRGRKA